MDYEIDKKNLKRCAEISRQSREAGNTPFGALLAGKDGSILLEQPNIEITEGKCTGHDGRRAGLFHPDAQRLYIQQGKCTESGLCFCNGVITGSIAFVCCNPVLKNEL